MEASQARGLCVAKGATLHATRLGPSRDKRRLAQDDKTMTFEQATIKVVSEREFGELKKAIDFVFASAQVEKFLKSLKSAVIRARDWERILAANVIDTVAGKIAGTAQSLYQAMAVSDQAQVREYYLSKVEEVNPLLRAKFHRVYQYS